MIRQAFTMKLKPGAEDEYIRRHQAVWPELLKLHSRVGIRNYSIYLDRATLTLFAYRELEPGHAVASFAEDPLAREWWAYNVDLMECHPTNAPVCGALEEVFHLP